MSKYKISVYAISKNEEKNVSKWYNSMKEADEIIVLDTGSTDNTINLLKKYPKIKLYQEVINPWRFDVARNKSLDLVSPDTDICVCTDLDETFIKGWRKKLEDKWQEGTTRCYYTYNWNFNEYNKPETTFLLNKIHQRLGYRWTHPVHEVLTPSIPEKYVNIPEIILNHHADNKKSRHSYLPLLELSVKEDPNDDRNCHYLGREYVFYRKWSEAIKTFHHHLHLKSSTWKEERAASMRYMAYCYSQLNYPEETIYWYKKSIFESPSTREPYYDLAKYYYFQNDYSKCITYIKKALKIKTKTLSYITNEEAWNEIIYDLLAVCYYYNKELSKSFYYSRLAKKIAPYNKRIVNNFNLIKEAYKMEKNPSS